MENNKRVAEVVLEKEETKRFKASSLDEFGEDEKCLILELVIQTSICCPLGLKSTHEVNKHFMSRWRDRFYMENLFREASRKSMQLFKETKHGAYLTNYFAVLPLAKVFGMVNTIWREIIDPLDTSLITENEYHTNYQTNKSRELLTKGILLGHKKEVAGSMTKDERHMMLDVAWFLKSRYGWVLDMDLSSSYSATVFIRSV